MSKRLGICHDCQSLVGQYRPAPSGDVRGAVLDCVGDAGLVAEKRAGELRDIRSGWSLFQTSPVLRLGPLKHACNDAQAETLQPLT